MSEEGLKTRTALIVNELMAISINWCRDRAFQTTLSVATARTASHVVLTMFWPDCAPTLANEPIEGLAVRLILADKLIRQIGGTVNYRRDGECSIIEVAIPAG